MFRRRRLLWFCVGLFVLVALLLWARPADRAAQPLSDADARYFSSLTTTLRSLSGLPCAAIDLDRLDHNLTKAQSALSKNQQLRIVVKSLPSLGLLRYILQKTGSHALMVFHAPQIPLLLRDLSDLGPLDILLGKPAPAEAAHKVMTQHPDAAQRVAWLIDDGSRLASYRDIARQLGQPIKVSIELDVGLHRGGVQTDDELRSLLQQIADAPSLLRFAGFMGYDGHVPHAPGLHKHEAIRTALVDVQTRYQHFVDVAKAARPDWFSPSTDRLVFNSGGSKTLPLYAGLPTVVNDLAMGSGLLRPASFGDDALADFLPALWLAVPVLKKQASPPLPFLDGMWGLFRLWDPNLAVGYFLYGGTWDAPIVYPTGLRAGWFHDGPIRNLLPNQQLLTGSKRVVAEVGSFVILHPREADNFAALSDLYAIRNGQVEAHWQPLSVLN